MLERVISGGQTGADQAGLRAARAAGIPTGGWAPKGWLTEDGPAPWLADWGLEERREPECPPRTIENAAAADLTIWFGSTVSPGALLTLRTVHKHGKAVLVVMAGMTASRIVGFLRRNPAIKVVNVAGNRESRSPGIGERTERFLAEVFRQLRALDGQPPAPG